MQNNNLRRLCSLSGQCHRDRMVRDSRTAPLVTCTARPVTGTAQLSRHSSPGEIPLLWQLTAVEGAAARLHINVV